MDEYKSLKLAIFESFDNDIITEYEKVLLLERLDDVMTEAKDDSIALNLTIAASSLATCVAIVAGTSKLLQYQSIKNNPEAYKLYKVIKEDSSRVRAISREMARLSKTYTKIKNDQERRVNDATNKDSNSKKSEDYDKLAKDAAKIAAKYTAKKIELKSLTTEIKKCKKQLYTIAKTNVDSKELEKIQKTIDKIEKNVMDIETRDSVKNVYIKA